MKGVGERTGGHDDDVGVQTAGGPDDLLVGRTKSNHHVDAEVPGHDAGAELANRFPQRSDAFDVHLLRCHVNHEQIRSAAAGHLDGIT